MINDIKKLHMFIRQILKPILNVPDTIQICQYSSLLTEGPQSEERKALLLSSNLNLALCYLKLNEPFEARNAATSVLEIDSNNEKALFRRGQAYLAIGEPQLAADDFKTLLSVEPNNSAAKVQLALCNKTLKEQLQKEKQIYANMFDKFAKMDTQVKI